MATNSITAVEIVDRVLVPAQVELWVRVQVREPSLAIDVRGRLTGPRLCGSTTVEVAYPLRPLPRPFEDPPGTITRKVVVPEASFWDPECPFLYEAIVELWDGDRLLDRKRSTHGLRVLAVSQQGLRINGQVRRLRGVHGAPARIADDPHPGFDLVLAPDFEDRWWSEGDRRGFLVLGRIERVADWAAAGTLHCHVSTLGFVLSLPFLQNVEVGQLRQEKSSLRSLLGLELTAPPAAPLPPEIDFIVCKSELLPAVATLSQPRLVLRTDAGERPEHGDAGTIGTIHCPAPER